MDPARWAQIKRLFQAALERTVEERQQFIVAACAGDPELRRELESALAQDLAANGRLDGPTSEGASTLPDEAGDLQPGAQIGPYRIEARIGRGGMGDVYKARDTRLGRLVAIKMVCPGVEDLARRQRFLREARAASALNHPNIVTIHDVITEGGTDYLVMEHVPGKTLDRVIPRRGVRAGELLHYAVQISDALAAAHAAGIVHRDIKPSNLMITNEGGLRVLDFGLAKLLEQDADTADSTRSVSLRTEEGIVLGSIPYMSPEQAEGKAVDARTDIFSLGAVLYEMCTGQRAFQGDSRASILAAVIAKEPLPIRQFAPNTPRELERTILRCLRKDRNRRFQSMRDLELTLEELKGESDSGTLTPSPQLVPPVKSRWRIQATIAAGAVALAFAGGWTWWNFKGEPPYRPLPFAQLTYDSGLTTEPAISLDGQLIAWSSDRAGEGSLDIWVQYRGGAPVRVTHNPADEYEPSFSPDGTQIVYRSDQDGGGIYVVSSLGGAEARLVARGGSRPRFSPDGSEILIDDVGAQSARIVNIAAPAAAPRRLAPELATVQTPVWSPDGQYLLMVGRKSVDNLIPSAFIVPRNGGAAEPVRFEYQSAWLETTAMAIDGWLPGDRVLGELEIRGSTHLWLARLRRNPWRLSGLEQITFGTGSVKNASVSRDGTIVASSEEMDVDLWSIPIDANQGRALGEPRRLTQDAAREQYPSISVDGSRLVYSSEQMGASHIWLIDLPSGAKRMLTSSSEFDFRPVISSDGRQIAYISANKDLFMVSPEMAVSNWVMATSGGPAQKLKTGSVMIWDWSNDARALTAWAYRLPRSVGVDIIDIVTGEAKPLLTRPRNLFQAHISHDGHWVMVQESGGGVLMAPILDAQPPAADLWQPIGLKGADLIRWSPDDNLIYFISGRDSFRCVWAQRLDPHTKRLVGEPFAIAHFHQARRSLRIDNSGKIGLAVARNQIVLAEAERTGNIWSANLGP
jgi:serine/threonine protein kinase/Tol biopolymer transport system component